MRGFIFMFACRNGPLVIGRVEDFYGHIHDVPVSCFCAYDVVDPMFSTLGYRYLYFAFCPNPA